MKKIHITNPNGILLQTSKKYLDDDILVTIDESLINGNGDTLKALFDYTKSTKNLFGESKNVTDLTGFIPYESTINVTNMSYMFHNCSNLKTIPLFNTSKVTDMSYMFNSCSSLTTIPSLDTNKVTVMSYMFNSCAKLEKIDITKYNMTSSSNTNYLFSNCYSLKSIIIRSFGSYSLNSNAFTGCYHILGTTNSTYNPKGDRDGYIYVPSEMVNTLKTATNWSSNANQIAPIFGFASNKEEYGSITSNINSNNETVLTAVSNEGYKFSKWIKGLLKPELVLRNSNSLTISDVEGASYNFTLNDNGYYQSANKGVGSSYAIGRFYFTISEENQGIELECINSGENGYDYGTIGKVDTALPLSTSDGSPYYNFKNVSSREPKKIFFKDLSIGEHFIDVKFRKDSGSNQGDDMLSVKASIGNIETVYIPTGTDYSNEESINVGVVDTMVMEPLNLVAIFEEE